MATEDDGSSVTLGTPDPSTGAVDQGSSDGASQLFPDLDSDTRGWAETKGYKSLADIAKAARNAESLIGKSVRVPGDDAKPEEVQAFYRKLGAPEKADEYSFTPVEGLPEGTTYDEEAASFRDVAHKANLTKGQAAALHDFIFGSAAQTIQQAQEEAATAKAERTAAATADLVKAWGGPVQSVEFKKANHLANRAIGDLGGAELVAAFKEAGLMSEEGHVLSPAIAKAFWNVGKKLYAEADHVGGDPASDVSNPFKEGPREGNMTEQNRLIKADPAKAQRLMREAGRKPEEWNLTPLAA